jgi:hypothetical protein
MVCREEQSRRVCDWQIKGVDGLTQSRLLSQSARVSRWGHCHWRAERRGNPQWPLIAGVQRLAGVYG